MCIIDSRKALQNPFLKLLNYCSVPLAHCSQTIHFPASFCSTFAKYIYYNYRYSHPFLFVQQSISLSPFTLPSFTRPNFPNQHLQHKLVQLTFTIFIFGNYCISKNFFSVFSP